MNKSLILARWLLVMLMIGSAAAAVSIGVKLWHNRQINAYIANPEAFSTVPDDPRAHFSYANLLERQNNHEKALEQLTRVLDNSDPALLPLAYFNRGNINLRKALKLTDSDSKQIPLVELAKQDYRSALALAPKMWNARYNLEVALRVVSETFRRH